MHDVIVVGARVAGAATGMLLARKGLDVLVVDRATFPSDTLSTHQVQVPGVARLRRWGLLDRVFAAGTPATRRVRFDPGSAVLEGRVPEVDGADALYSPRRTLLDALLVEAARQAGAEVRERFTVDEVLAEDGRVVGIRGGERGSGRPPVTERARLVVGADGRHSLVAKAVNASAYRETASLTCAYYTYWSGVPLEGGEMYGRPRRVVGAWPTNDGLVMTYVAAPAAEFKAFKTDVEGYLLATLDEAGDLGERVRAGERAERIAGSGDLPSRFRTPYGLGWALVGDAGLVIDPITGQGIGHAFRDAELLADAVASGLDGGPPLETTLADYARRRDEDASGMYDFTCDLASFPQRPEGEVLFRALAGAPEQTDRFFAVLAGVLPPGEFFGPRNIARILGARGMARAIRTKVRAGRG